MIEKCRDGWFKGSSLVTLKTGVFPGNYVVHVNEHLKPTQAPGTQSPNQQPGTNHICGTNQSSAAGAKSDLIEFDSLLSSKNSKNPEGALKPPEGVAGKGGEKSKSGKSVDTTTTLNGDRYEVIETFPSSNEYELDLVKGDIVIMVKQREDGWCKGVHLKSKKTGLFPSSFVKKMRL